MCDLDGIASDADQNAKAIDAAYDRAMDRAVFHGDDPHGLLPREVTATGQPHPAEARLAEDMDRLPDGGDAKDAPQPVGAVPVSFSDPRDGSPEDCRPLHARTTR